MNILPFWGICAPEKESSKQVEYHIFYKTFLRFILEKDSMPNGENIE